MSRHHHEHSHEHRKAKAAVKVQTLTRGHLSRQNTRFLSVDMPALVNQWLDCGFEAVVWDFDRTVMRIHAFARGVKVEEVAERWREDVADLEFFRAMVLGATQRGMRVGIASFGRRPVVLEYLRHMFADNPGLFTEANVLTPGALPGFNDGMDVKGGKPMLLELLCSTAPVISERARVLFFDDDHQNILDCRETGFVYAFHTPDYFARYALWIIANAPPAEGEFAVPKGRAPITAVTAIDAAAAAAIEMVPSSASLPGFAMSNTGRQPSMVAEEPSSPDPWQSAAPGAGPGPGAPFRTLMAAGHAANRAGELERARQCFEEAGALWASVRHTGLEPQTDWRTPDRPATHTFGPRLGQAVASISAANMSLKLGQRARAVAEYEAVLRTGYLSPAEGGYPEGLGEDNRTVVERKLLEARQLPSQGGASPGGADALPSYHLGARRGIAGLGVSMAGGLTAGAGGLTAAAAAAYVHPGKDEKEAAPLQLYAAEVEQLRDQWEQAQAAARTLADELGKQADELERTRAVAAAKEAELRAELEAAGVALRRLEEQRVALLSAHDELEAQRDAAHAAGAAEAAATWAEWADGQSAQVQAQAQARDPMRPYAAPDQEAAAAVARQGQGYEEMLELLREELLASRAEAAVTFRSI